MIYNFIKDQNVKINYEVYLDMTIFKNYSNKEKLRFFITLFIYIVFSIYTIGFIIKEPNFYVKLMFLSILIIFLSISLWAEYLKYLYQSSIYHLNISLDLDRAVKIFEKLNKLDFFRSYKKTFLIFKVLYNMCLENYEQCLSIIEQNDNFFRSSLDNLLIQKYTYFFCSYKTNQFDNIEKYYQNIQELKNLKIKKSKVSPLYNWEFIDAIYFKFKNNLQKSKVCFENTNTTNMNNRELLTYLKEYEDVLLKLNLNDKAKKIRNKIKKTKDGDYFENK